MADIGFLLLAGGRSRRMGFDKALIEIDGITLLERTATAGEAFAERILSANDDALPTPKGFVRCADIYRSCGPMAGIHAGLVTARSDALVTAPCDAPHYSGKLARFMAGCFDPALDALVLLDRDGRAQPLYAVYHVRCAPVLEAHLKAGKLKLLRLFECINVEMVLMPDWLDDTALHNLNTPDELASFKKHR